MIVFNGIVGFRVKTMFLLYHANRTKHMMCARVCNYHTQTYTHTQYAWGSNMKYLTKEKEEEAKKMANGERGGDGTMGLRRKNGATTAREKKKSLKQNND